MDIAGLPQRIDARLARGRAMAEARMPDTCRITRPGDGQRVFNQTTGQYEDPPPVTVYEGKCLIPSGGGQVTKDGAGPQSFGVGEYPLDLPATSAGFTAGERLAAGQTVTYLTAPYQPYLEGMVFGLTEPLLVSQGTKQRWKIKTAVTP